MPRDAHLTRCLRLEDAVALAFFLINLALRLIFWGLASVNVGPADVLAIIPAVCLLLAKELGHYFVAGRAEAQPAGSLESFVRPYWSILRDWFPFLVILMMYYSLWGNATHLLVSTDRDAMLIAWDQKLFGFQASVWLERFVTPALTGWMSFAYFFHLLNLPLVACFIYLRRSTKSFREMMCGLLVVSFFGILGYLLVPAIGPMYTLRDRYTAPLAEPLGILNRQMDFMDFARIHRDVFPSLHAGISFVVWLYAYRNSRRLFWILSPLVLSLWVSTVYLRYHYLVDVLAGLALAPPSFWLANWLFRRWNEIVVSIALPAGWVARWPSLGTLGASIGRADGSGKAAEP
jgi:membrane-associated phospholipid phosphatase